MELIEADAKKSEEEKKNDIFDTQTFQNKQISNLLSFLSEYFTMETMDQSHITNFFFSFYSLDKTGTHGGNEKTPVYLNIF